MILRSLESEWSHLLPRVCHACGHSIPVGSHSQGACRRTVIAICAGVPRTCEGRRAGSSGAKGRDGRQRVVGGLSGWMKKCLRGAMRCRPRRVRVSPWLPGMGRGDCLLIHVPDETVSFGRFPCATVDEAENLRPDGLEVAEAGPDRRLQVGQRVEPPVVAGAAPQPLPEPLD